MKGSYKAAFILPKDAKKKLGDDGWEFESSQRLPSEVSELLADSLGLKYLESYLGIDVYTNAEMKMSVERDDQSLIEFISFQIYGDVIDEFKEKVRACSWCEQVDNFIPSEEK